MFRGLKLSRVFSPTADQYFSAHFFSSSSSRMASIKAAAIAVAMFVAAWVTATRISRPRPFFHPFFCTFRTADRSML